MVMLLAMVFVAVTAIAPRANIYLIPILVIGFAYFSGKWHAYWAPVADEMRTRSWNSKEGSEMETVLELAHVHTAVFGGADAIRQTVWRISVYDRTRKRRTTRIMIGEDAKFLGEPGGYYWFYIGDRFYSKVAGLTAFDRQTGAIKFNRPKKEGFLTGTTSKTHIIKMDIEETKDVPVDLKELAKLIDDEPTVAQAGK